jgi:hypothetical protein
VAVSHLDPTHLAPWNHYFVEMYERWKEKDAFGLVAGGSLLFVFDTFRRRWPEGFLTILWFALPLAIISMGTSKLFHYAYPFLPPVGLAAGHLIARFWALLRPLVDRALAPERGLEQIRRWSPGFYRVLRLPAVRAVVLATGVLAICAFVWTVLLGPFNVDLAGIPIRNSRLLRPALIAILGLILAGQMHLIGRIGVAFLILAMLPVVAYRATLQAFQNESRVFRDSRECVLRVGSRPELMTAGPRGMYVDLDAIDFVLPHNHEFPYYLRSIRPWIRPNAAPPSRLYKFITDPAEQRPLLLTATRYHEIIRGYAASTGQHLSVPRVALHDDAVLVLPGPYAVCEAEQIGRHHIR